MSDEAFDIDGAEFDRTPEVFFDQPLWWLLERHKMKISLNLRSLIPAEHPQFGQAVINAMTGNAETPTPNPPLSELQTLVDTANDKLAAFDIAQSAVQMALVERDA